MDETEDRLRLQLNRAESRRASIYRELELLVSQEDSMREELWTATAERDAVRSALDDYLKERV